MPRRQHQPTASKLVDLLDSWRLSLEAGNRAPKTLATYGESGRSLADYLGREGLPITVDAIEREHIERWLADLTKTRAPGTVSVRYRAMRQFWKWALREGEIERDPMGNIAGPIVPEQPVPVLDTDEIRALLKACEGSSFDDRRDNALIRVMFDCGLRRNEAAVLRIDDVDFTARQLHAFGKGRRARVIPFGVKTVQSLDRYRRVRGKHPHAALSYFWLGTSHPWQLSRDHGPVVARPLLVSPPGDGEHSMKRWVHSCGVDLDLDVRYRSPLPTRGSRISPDADGRCNSGRRTSDVT